MVTIQGITYHSHRDVTRLCLWAKSCRPLTWTAGAHWVRPTRSKPSFWKASAINSGILSRTSLSIFHLGHGMILKSCKSNCLAGPINGIITHPETPIEQGKHGLIPGHHWHDVVPMGELGYYIISVAVLPEHFVIFPDAHWTSVWSDLTWSHYMDSSLTRKRICHFSKKHPRHQHFWKHDWYS